LLRLIWQPVTAVCRRDVENPGIVTSMFRSRSSFEREFLRNGRYAHQQAGLAPMNPASGQILRL
jgi:hypothetical protein